MSIKIKYKNQKGLNVLSFFDGMSCGMIALERAGIKVNKYYAAEIDKYAIAVSKHNYPNIIHLGDVRDVKLSDLPRIDLFIGGSPCQGFSFSGKQLAFDDPRSKLFFKYDRMLKQIQKYNPDVKFLLENVRMKKEHLNVITRLLNVEPILINSALVSAQNRNRYYWTNIYGIKQPSELGLILKGIIISGETDKYKSNAVIANYSKTSLKNYLKNQGQMIICGDAKGVGGYSQKRKVYSIKGKSPTVTADFHRGGGNEGKICLQVGTANIKGFDSNKRIYSIDHKSPTLFSNSGGNRETKIAIQGPKGNQTLNGLCWRKLEPIECERLQTIPDNYTLVPHPVFKNKMMSNSQRYKMIGNAWTVDVIVHILKCFSNKDTKLKQQTLPGF